MKKIYFLIFNLFFLFLIFNLLFLPPAMAAYFSLEPKTYTASVDGSFNVQLKIDTEGEQTTSADAILIFDQNILEITDVSAGDFYPQNFKNISAGKAYIGGSVKNATEYKVGQGTLATVTFKGKGGGTTIVRFDCTPGKTTDSNITKNDPEATDVLDCTKLVNGTYTVGNPGGSTSRPTFAPTCSPSPTAQLPPSGIVFPSVFLLVIGGLLTILGGLIIL